MSWARHAIDELAQGRRATVRPRGHSMRPKVIDNARVTLRPNHAPAALAKGDIVLVRVKGNVYLHLISATDTDRVQISNNRGRVNGWVSRTAVYGVAEQIDNP